MKYSANLSSSLSTIKNIDQLTKQFIGSLKEFNDEEENGDKQQIIDAESINSLIKKYFICLKSQQNINRQFNRFCSQILFGLLILIEKLKKLGKDASNAASDQAWNLIRFCLLSKSHSNVYMDFFKNLPTSFSAKSNYQVSVLFTTIRNDASLSQLHFSSVCANVHLILRELLGILNLNDYKLKCSIVQFFIDLIRNLKVNESADKDHEYENGVILKALRNLFQVVDEFSIYCIADDENHGSIFRNWFKSLLEQTFTTLTNDRFNSNHAELYVKMLDIDHHILDANLDLLLKKLNQPDQEAFLIKLLDANVKYRQLSRCTHKLIDCLAKNASLNLPDGFYLHYESSLENHHVDIQTIVNLWQDLLKLTENPTVSQNLILASTRFLNCILSRVNLANTKLPAHVRTQSYSLLIKTKSHLFETIVKIYSSSSSAEKNEMLLLSYLNCLNSCGLLFVIVYRYSIQSNRFNVSNSSSIGSEALTAHSSESTSNLNKFLSDLNGDLFDLIGKINDRKTNRRRLLHLNRLQIVNVYAANVIAVHDDSSQFDAIVLSKLNENVGVFLNHLLNQISDDQQQLKDLLINNLYLIIRIFDDPTRFGFPSNEADQMRTKLVRFVLNYLISSSDAEIFIDKINENAIFNDRTLLGDIFKAFLSILADADAAAESSNKKQFSRLIQFIESAIKPTMNIDNEFELNQIQTELFFKLVKHLPVEYLSAEFALIIFLLNRSSSTKSGNKQRQIQLFNRLFGNQHLVDLMNMLSLSSVQAWILSLFNTEAADSVIFENLIKKSLNYLLKKETDFQTLIDLVRKLLLLKREKSNAKNLIQMKHQSFIYILNRLCYIKENNHSQQSGGVNEERLEFLFDTLIEYFVQFDKEDEEEGDQDTEVEQLMSHESTNFIVCSILMRKLSSTSGSDQSTAKKSDYFRSLMERCQKHHKKRMKSLLKQDNKQNENKYIFNKYQIDFVKSCCFYSAKLDEKKLTLKINRMKYVQNLIEILMLNDSNDSSHDDHENSDNNSLISSILYSMNHLNGGDEFEQILQSIQLALFSSCSSSCDNDDESTRNRQILKIFHLIQAGCCDLEFTNEQNRQLFADFVEKVFMIQTLPIIEHHLNSNSSSSQENLDLIINLLNVHQTIAAASSKHISLPSQVAVSIFQIFSLLPLESLSLEHYFQIQQIICKSISNLMMKYSKKFGKCADIVVSLLLRLTSSMTMHSNQTNLRSEQQLEIAVKAAQDLDRVFTQLAEFKKDFSKLAPYLISEYATKATLVPVHPALKTTLLNGIYNLISICDIHGVSQLHVILNPGSKELFRQIYAEYEKYFKYTGKA